MGLARAIAVDPELFLLDEPTTGLDAIMADQIDGLILKMVRVMGSTVVLITHDIDTLTRAATELLSSSMAAPVLQARGMESCFEGQDPLRGAVTAERVSGVGSVAQALAYCEAAEPAAGCDVPERCSPA